MGDNWGESVDDEDEVVDDVDVEGLVDGFVMFYVGVGNIGIKKWYGVLLKLVESGNIGRSLLVYVEDIRKVGVVFGVFVVFR